MPRASARVLALCVLGPLLVAGCQRAQDTAAPMVTPTVTISRAEAPIGSVAEMTYRFVVAPQARFDEDYMVFVHFLDTDRELMWTDDHQPPVKTTQWKPGATIEYARTMFVPKFPYVGETRVEVGLFSPSSGERVPMAGTNVGQRSYQVATFTLTPQNENLFVVFSDGWQATEIANEGVGIEWQWSRKEGVLAFRNPMRDVTLYLQLDQPVTPVGAQQVEVRLGSAVLDRFDLPPGQRELRRIPITRDQLGSAEAVEVTIVPSKTFVPASIPELRSQDARELGVRVFRAYLEAS